MANWLATRMEFGVAGMHVAAFECYFGYGCVEVFEFEFADLAAVHSVGPVGVEEADIEFMCSLADFFIGVEGYADVAVFDFRVFDEVVNGCDYFGDSGFVIGSEEGVAVGHDEVLTFVVEQFGEFGGFEHDSFGGVEYYVIAVVVFDDARSHVFSAHVRRCVEVGDEADCGNLLVNVAFERCHQIAVVIKNNVVETHCAEFFFKMLREDHLSGG